MYNFSDKFLVVVTTTSIVLYQFFPADLPVVIQVSRIKETSTERRLVVPWFAVVCEITPHCNVAKATFLQTSGEGGLYLR